MSQFGTKLDELLRRKKWKPIDLHRASGVSQPKISRFITGVQTWVDPKDFALIVAGISSDPKEQAELLRARLLDECHGPGADHIEIKISGSPSRNREKAPSNGLPPQIQSALNNITENVIRDRKLKDIIVALGTMYSKKT